MAHIPTKKHYMLLHYTNINLLPQSLAWLLGFGANHSLLFFVQYWHHHIETRQIQYKGVMLQFNATQKK